MGFCGKCGEPILNHGCCPCGGEGADSTTSGMSQATNSGDQYSNAYLSSGLNIGIEKGIKKMLGHDAKVNEVCLDCGRKIASEDDLFVGPDNRQVYCQKCYSVHYKKGNCQKCQKAVLGLGKEYVHQDNQFWHKECFDAGKSCHVCHNVIIGAAMEALSHFYHVQCFNCVNCVLPISGPFIDNNGEVCCKLCFEKIKGFRPAFSAPLITKPTVANEQQQQQSMAPHGNRAGFATSGLCTKCNESICNVSGSPDTGVTLSSGKGVHVRCFNCHDCGKSINGQFIADGENLYHPLVFIYTLPQCRQSITILKAGGKQLMCSGCNLAVTSSYTKHEDEFYHADCFKCSSCRNVIGSQGYMESPIDKKAVCEDCFNKSSTKSNNVPAVPIYRAGLKPNPGGPSNSKCDKSGSSTTGGRNVCPFCAKQAFPSEQIPGPVMTVWHRQCLKCTTCRKQLDSAAKLNQNKPYCVACNDKLC